MSIPPQNDDSLTDWSEFLEGFFGPGNALRWSEFCSEPTSPLSQFLQPWIDTLHDVTFPAILPRKHEQPDLRTTWYALAFTHRQARALRESLLAFVGPSYSSFVGQPAALDPHDPVERTIVRRFNTPVYRLTVVHPADRDRVRTALRQMHDYLKHSTPRSFSTTQPIGRLLAEFDRALLQGNERVSHDLFASIQSSGRLSAQNVACLRIRLLSTFDRWSELAELPETRSLLLLPCPTLVGQALQRATRGQIDLSIVATPSPARTPT